MLSVYFVVEICVTVKCTKILRVSQECFYGKFFASNYAKSTYHSFSETNYISSNLHFFFTRYIRGLEF